MLKHALLATAAILALALSAISTAHSQELVVGTFAEVPPFEYATSDGRTIGFDIDVIKAICREADLIPRFVSQPLDSLLDTLAAGRFHVVAAALTITEERKRQVDFSEPYFGVNIVAVVPEGAKMIDSLEQLKNLRVSVLTGTTCAAIVDKTLGENANNVRKLGRYSDVLEDITDGRADVAIMDEPVAKSFAANAKGFHVGVQTLHVEEYGFAVRKGDATTLTMLNAGLKKLRDTGEFELINRIWFAD